LAIALLMGPGSAMSAESSGVGCGEFEQRLKVANDSGGLGEMAREMSRLLAISRLAGIGMDHVEAVKCALNGSGEVYMVINTALAAGIDRDKVKKGIERSFNFDPLRSMPEPEPEADLGLFMTGNRFRLEVNVFGGISIANTFVARSLDNKEIDLDGGGGYGGGLTLGYGISHRWDMDLALGYHVTDMDPVPAGSKGSFERYSALVSFKHRLYAKAKSWVKFGIGAGYFVPVRYKISSAAGFLEVEYDDAPGGMVSVEYEAAIGEDSERSTFVLGLRYYYVVYDAVMAFDAGGPIVLTSLPKEMVELDGSSAEITVGIATYF